MSYARSRFDPVKPFPESASVAEKIANQFDNDWTFRRPILTSLPDRLATPVADRYIRIYEKDGRQAANLFLLDIKDDLSKHALSLAASDDDLVSFAKKAATDCFFQRMRFRNDKQAYEFMLSYLSIRYRITIPPRFKIKPRKNSVTVTDSNVTVKDTVTEKNQHIRNITLSVEGILNRFSDELWWRRTLRNTTIRNVEKRAIDLGLVHRNAGIYISDETMQRKRQQKRRNKLAAEKSILINELGQEYTLQELIDNSLANPSNRRAELMVRIRGTEETSKALGHIAVLYTITCPSRMHARLARSGDANPKYDGTSPQEAQKYLTKTWSQIRSKLKRDGLTYYGFRVVEPHHDGTPHWHLLIFMPKANFNQITNIMRAYAMRENENENGAAEHRFTVVKVDPKRGSATGYIAKYISKSIDGYGIDDDLYGKDAKNSAKRIANWASTWNVRQFQQLGGPPVTLYRELRRTQGKELKGLLLEAWEAADKGDWETFIKLMGGPAIKRKDCSFKIARQWSDEPNRYLEPQGYQIIGVSYMNVTIPTHIHQWTVTFNPESQKHKIRTSPLETSPLDTPAPPLEPYPLTGYETEKKFSKGLGL